jgi:hypothetical protein
MDRADFIEAMQVLTLEPGDTLVIKTKLVLQRSHHEAVQQYIKELVGDVPVLILDNGMDIGILRRAA